MHRASGVILAGGLNTRMQANKALLGVDGRPIIHRQLAVLRRVCTEVLLVANDPEPYQDGGIPIIGDRIPGGGPLSGIHAGLLAAGCERVFFVACDMPFLSERLVRYLLEQTPDFDVVVPRLPNGLEPLHAVYSKACLPYVEECLRRKERRIVAFYPQVRVRYVDKEEMATLADLDKAFYNVNTPQELERARGWGNCGDVDAGEKDALPPIISVVGKSDSGKTTLLEKLLPELKRRGYRVATVKHDAHSFDIDHPGKDSWRHAQAGADVVAVSSPEKLAVISRVDHDHRLEEIVPYLPPVDLVLSEGYKRGDKIKIEVHRRERGGELLCTPDELLAVATDEPLDVPVPCLHLDDAAGLADLIEERFLLRRKRGEKDAGPPGKRD